MSVERLKAQKEIEELKKDAVRLTELRQFLAINTNPGNRKRVEEISEELKRIAARLSMLERFL